MTLAPTTSLLTDTGRTLSRAKSWLEGASCSVTTFVESPEKASVRAVTAVTLAVSVLLIGLFPSLAELGRAESDNFVINPGRRTESHGELTT